MKDLSIVFIVFAEMKIVLLLAGRGHMGALYGEESAATAKVFSMY